MKHSPILLGDCADVLRDLKPLNADLIYADPPFFTQKKHQLSTRSGEHVFSFSDAWSSNSDFATFMHDRIKLMHAHLKDTGSIFVHCDTNSNYIFRVILNDIFGEKNFKSEIIWSYKRWSNSSRKLLPNHQYILYYSKSDHYIFHKLFEDYAPTTNLDQILQKRSRDNRNKSIYAKDGNGNIILDSSKKGVPLSDVWNIPFLNPKAAERVGYPTQKPVLLMEKILSAFSNENDLVVDPFCGSGSMLVAAKLMNRKYLGIDKSEDAVRLSEERLSDPRKTSSKLIARGDQYYDNLEDGIKQKLMGVECNFVQRNKGIDAILKKQIRSKNVFIRVQRHKETVQSAIDVIEAATANKGASINIVIVSEKENMSLFETRKKQNTILIEDLPTKINNIEDHIEQLTSSHSLPPPWSIKSFS